MIKVMDYIVVAALIVIVSQQLRMTINKIPEMYTNEYYGMTIAWLLYGWCLVVWLIILVLIMIKMYYSLTSTRSKE